MQLVIFSSIRLARKKNGSEPTFEEKFKRGSQRDRKWGDHSYITELRADCAKIQNEVLEKNGFSIRVDHRTLKAQKEEAERNGDIFLARLFNRVPEKYIGIIPCKENDDPQFAKLKEFRQLRQKHYNLILKTDSLTKETDELETKDAVQISSTKAKKLIDSEQFLHSNPNSFQDLKSKMFSAVIFLLSKKNKKKLSTKNLTFKPKLFRLNVLPKWQKIFLFTATSKNCVLTSEN